jgi:hypothetical protein
MAPRIIKKTVNRSNIINFRSEDLRIQICLLTITLHSYKLQLLTLARNAPLPLA